MTLKVIIKSSRNYFVLVIQNSLFKAGRILASPSVVLTYMAVALDQPVFLVALLIPIRKTAGFSVSLFSADFVASIDRRIFALALTVGSLAACYAIIVTSVVYGGSSAVALALMFMMFAIGSMEQYQSLIASDVLGDVLHTHDRKRLQYSTLTLGGLSALALTWGLHVATSDMTPLNRHAIVMFTAVLLFVVSAVSVLMLPKLEKSSTTQSPVAGGNSLKLVATQFVRNLMRLLPMPWFRRYMIVRLMLLSVGLSVPFYAILAALSHGTTQKGLTSLLVAAASANLIAGQVWGFVGRYLGNVGVIIMSSLLAALSGFILITNHFLELTNSILVHSVTLFTISIAAQGVSAAHKLVFLDLAPKDERVAGLAVSKAIQTFFAVGVSFIMATLAHVQHVVWSILFLMLLAILCAVVSNVAGIRPQAEELPT